MPTQADVLERMNDAAVRMQELTDQYQNKIDDINNEVTQAQQICQQAADDLGNGAKTLMSWVIPQSTLTVHAAKMIGIEDTTVDSGNWDTAQLFNPVKLGQDNLLWEPDFENPNWTGETNPWRNLSRSGDGDLSHQQLVDENSNPCWVDLQNLNQMLVLDGLREMANLGKLKSGKLPYFIMRCSVDGQIHGRNRTFIQLLTSSAGSSSSRYLNNGDGTYDHHTPRAISYPGGFQQNGFSVAVDSAGHGGIDGTYNTTAVIPLRDISYNTKSFRIVNIGFKALHIQAYGIAYLDSTGLEME